MKVTQCDWAPSLVVEWLCGQLEERGIPGSTYAHTLLSLLHTQYCPHPPLSTGIGTPTSSLSHRRHNSRNPRQLDPRQLNLEELLDELPHPDADLPDLTSLTASLKCGGSRRARKRFRVRQKHRIFTTEELQKVAALHCLMSASDEELQYYDLENLIEELCSRLKLSKDGESGATENKSMKTNAVSRGSEESGNDTDDSNLEELAQRYYEAFPPLNMSFGEGYSASLAWKQSCKCVWEGNEPVHESDCSLVPSEVPLPDHTNDLNQSNNLQCKPQDNPNNLEVTSEHMNEKHVNGNAKEFEKSVDLFQTGFVDDDIPEGYIGDISSRESSEDRDKDDEISLRKNGKEKDLTKSSVFWEEWECAGNMGDNAKKSKSAEIPPVIKKISNNGRLFERFCAAGEDGEEGESKRKFSVKPEIEDESMKLLEKKISNSVAQVWGQNTTESVAMNHVWDPPSMQDLVSYNKNDVDVSSQESLPQSNVNEELFPGLPTINADWTRKSFSGHLLHTEKGPIFPGAFSYSPNIILNENVCNADKQCLWPDFNANDISENLRKSNSNLLDLEERRVFPSLNEQKKLCESFQQFGLEQIWGNETKSLECVYPNLGLSINPLDFVSNDLIEPFDEETELEAVPNKMDLELMFRQPPSGPTGPHAVLRHTESSGFSTVIPRKSVDNLTLELHNSNSTSSSSIPANFNQDGAEAVLPVPEEENLLTSPRTHFKPIRQDGYGHKADNISEDGQTIGGGFQPPELPFQRTGSGALFLESDVLEGSPKKYMVYREPPNNKTGLEDENEVVHQKITNAVPLIPKFKVINNEKCSQTEGEQLSLDALRKARKDNHKKINSFQLCEESDRFYGLSDIWKSESANKDELLDRIWQQAPLTLTSTSSYEIWEQRLSETENTKFLSGSWMKDMSKTSCWSTEENFDPTIKSKSIDIPKPADNWPEYVNNSSNFSSLAGLKSLWKEEGGQEDSSVNGSNNGTFFNRSVGLTSLGNSCDKKLWTSNDPSEDNDPENNWLNISFDQRKDMLLHPEKSSATIEDVIEETTANKILKFPRKVDKEAAEMFDTFLSMHNDYSTNGAESKSVSHLWSNGQTMMSGGEGLGSSAVAPQQDREDLDNLEPGWELNEGFEWDPPQIDEDDDLDSEDGGDCEVLYYKADDGNTYTIPVEYLDDTLYDEIFGSDDKPIGGSLPDLPSGEGVDVRMIEEHWRKSQSRGQLSRKSRGGKWLPPSRRPCSFFMEGNCKRPDCKFSHDLASITCRFWEEGTCLKGQTCPFMHGYPLKRRRNRSEGSQSISEIDSVDNVDGFIHGSTFEIDSETDFPSLGTSVESKRSTPDECGAASSANVKTKKKRKFITITKNVIGEDRSERCGRLFRRRISRRQKRSNRQGDNDANNGQVVEAAPPQEKKKIPAVLKKLEKHRTSASGHDDGTVSDY